MNHLFDTFREAGQFAASFCLEHRTTASVQQIDGRWAVVASDEFQAQGAREAEDIRLAEQRQLADQHAAAVAIQRAERGQKRFEERQSYFSALSKDALQALWDNRERPLDERELEIVRALLRKAIGFKPSSPPATRAACSRCFMVGEACICR